MSQEIRNRLLDHTLLNMHASPIERQPVKINKRTKEKINVLHIFTSPTLQLKARNRKVSNYKLNSSNNIHKTEHLFAQLHIVESKQSTSTKVQTNKLSLNRETCKLHN